jgi:hypothetical protein
VRTASIIRDDHPSETSVDNHFTRQYNPEDSSEHHTRRRENLKSHMFTFTLWHRKTPTSLHCLSGIKRRLMAFRIYGNVNPLFIDVPKAKQTLRNVHFDEPLRFQREKL